MNPSAKVITGPLHPDNIKGACDWGYQGFLAYGCHGYVVVIDPKTLQVIQTLGPHNSCVTHVRWCKEKYHHAFATGSTYNLLLASTDTEGNVLIWDVVTGNIRTAFCDSQPLKQISCIEWYCGHDESHDLLLVMRSFDILEMWDAYTGVRLWKTDVGETLLSFTLDPFDIQRFVVLCQSTRILTIPDLSVTKEPCPARYRYIQFADPSPSVPAQKSRRKSSSSSEKSSSLRSSTSWTKVASMATSMISGPESVNRSSEYTFYGSASLLEEYPELVNSCLQAVFNPAHRHSVLLVFPTEVQILDIDVELVVGVIRLDRSSASFVKVLPCRYVDMLFCLHENGSATVRVRRQTPTKHNQDLADVAMEMTYDLRCQSDSLRLLRQSKVFSFVYHPVTEKQMCIVLSDSRMIFLEVMTTEFSKIKDNKGNMSDPRYTLADLTTDQIIVSPSSMLKQGQMTLKLPVTGLLSGVIAPITVVAMVPSHVKDSKEVGKLLAIGSSIGTIQLVDVYSGQVVNEYKLFMSPVRHLEWMDSHKIITYSFPDPPSYGSKAVKSEIIVLNTKSGEVTAIRDNKGKDTPITMLKVSPSSKYFVIAVEDKHYEIWNIAKRLLVKRFELHELAPPTDIAWYPYVTYTKEGKGTNKEVEKIMTAEQLFICIQHDVGGLVRLNILDGSVSDVLYFAYEFMFGNKNTKIEILCIAWKVKNLVLADKGGQLYLFDARTKDPARKIFCKQGYKAKSIVFAPGKTNMRFMVLYVDSIDVWDIVSDAGQVEMVTSSPTLPSTLTHAVWTGPESVVMITDNACLHVLNISPRKPGTPVKNINDGFFHVSENQMKIQRSPVNAWSISDVFSPALMEPKLAFLLKYSLQCQIKPFNETIAQHLQLLESDVVNYIKNSSSIADRCYIVARLFGDEFDIDFWRLVKYSTQAGTPDKTRLPSIGKSLDISEWFSRLLSGRTEVTDLVDLSSSDLDSSLNQDDPTQNEMDISWVREMERDENMVSCLDVMMSRTDYMNYESGRLALHNKKRCNYRLQSLCAARYIMMDKVENAIQVLMETDVENTEFKTDCLKACFSSCVTQTSTSLSTIKLAATHLIAAGHLTDGVELLCLIDKRLDACKYLISYNNWQDAVWMAKTSMRVKEGQDIMCKWAEYLWQNNQKNKAVLVMVSAGQYTTAVLMLCEMKQYDTATLFLQTCLEAKLLHQTKQTDCVYVEFAKLLSVMDYQSAMRHYCHLAGEKWDKSP